MTIKSLDPRVNRLQLDPNEEIGQLDQNENFQTFEVFQQLKRGTHHVHVGSVHAPNKELAMIFAKDQFARRGVCVNLWVVETSAIFTTPYEDEDIFATTIDKKHRDPESYKVMDKIQAYKERVKQ